MSDKSKQPFDKLKKGFSNILKGRKPSAFTGKANVLGSGSSSQSPNPSSRPPYNPRAYQENPKPKPKPKPNPNPTSTPTPSQPWSLEDSNQNSQKNDELTPMNEFNPYQAAAISSTVLQAAANVPQYQQQNVPLQQEYNAPETYEHNTSQVQEEVSGQVPEQEEHNAYVQHNEVGYDSEALELSLAMISSHENQSDCFEIVGKLFRNIVGNPSELKYRKLRLSNQKIVENIVNISGGLELLQSVGFQIVEENGDQFAILAIDSDLAGVEGALSYIQDHTKNSNNSNSNSNSNQASNNLTQSIQIQQDTQNQVQKRDRNTKVFLPITPDTDVPDWFFERTTAEIKQEYFSAKKRREQNKVLMTQEMREKLNILSPQNNQQKSFAQVRIRFPEGVVLQGEFGLKEQCMSIYIWVEECLRVSGQTFDLILPNRQALQQNLSIQKADLVPQTLMNLNWSGQSAIEMKNVPGLKDELLQQASLSAQM